MDYIFFRFFCLCNERSTFRMVYVSTAYGVWVWLISFTFHFFQLHEKQKMEKMCVNTEHSDQRVEYLSYLKRIILHETDFIMDPIRSAFNGIKRSIFFAVLKRGLTDSHHCVN